ncbi:VOC family protein [Vibrio alginolyticus]|uniref:VOC family protein n=1 Tax=Vibrio alginolyticus TaxID=663 RepID=UPI003D7E1559
MISHFDHIVLTVSDIRRAVDFYTRVLRMEDVTFANGRKAVAFGNQKLTFNSWAKNHGMLLMSDQAMFV